MAVTPFTGQRGANWSTQMEGLSLGGTQSHPLSWERAEHVRSHVEGLVFPVPSLPVCPAESKLHGF